MISYPHTRLRRNRKALWSRLLVAENNVTVNDLIWPVFVIEGQNMREKIALLPGVERLSIDIAIKEIKEAVSFGINAIALFCKIAPSLCDERGSEAQNRNNLICRAIRAIKDEVPNVGIICDVALDLYTLHGHDGLLDKYGNVDNDATLELLVAQSLVQAEAGCDILAPSDMMDGRVGSIRAALEQNGYKNTQILAYTAKYASCFYGPFRQAVGSMERLKGDKKTYQMDFANVKEALEEAESDINEGADIIMVKPAMFYLDVIREFRENFNKPIFAYQVSGEYSMLSLAANAGAYNLKDAVIESLTACKRAGASAIITYFAAYLAKEMTKEITKETNCQ